MARLLQANRGSRPLGNLVRTWWAMRCQKRRRRHSGPTLPAPSNLTADSQGFGMSLGWDMTGVTGVDGCAIECRLGEGLWTDLGLRTTGVQNWAWVTVAESGLWSFRVRAVKGSAHSAYSNVATAGTVPVAPTALSLEVYGSFVVIRWSYAGPDVTGFRVYRVDPGAPDPFMVYAAGAGERSAPDSGITPDVEYSYWVVAYNDYGEAASVTVTVPVE